MEATVPKPTASIVVGMAGAGKTTFMQRLNSHLHAKKLKPYILNLDPAVLHLPYAANIDIRDTINYKQVMKQYSLGPNGGILTSLNLFTTKFDQVLTLLEKRAADDTMSHILIDTPGQIEIFTWSASGAIITDALASSFPTVLTYIIDAPRSKSCSTFISSMLYAVSILYKTKLPMIVVFNKTDMHPCDEQIKWMRDFETFQLALRREEERGETQGSGYMNSLMNSMSLVLEEFYNHLDVVGVSSVTGEGFDEYVEAMERKREAYETVYKPELESLRAKRDVDAETERKEQLQKLMKDMQVNDPTETKARQIVEGPAETVSDAEAEDEHDGELLDPDDEEKFESVERHPGDPTSSASSASRRNEAGSSQIEQLAELMGAVTSLREARNL
jgi:GTPase SAR1 family protein